MGFELNAIESRQCINKRKLPIRRSEVNHRSRTLRWSRLARASRFEWPRIGPRPLESCRATL